jgi:hypothetical protein
MEDVLAGKAVAIDVAAVEAGLVPRKRPRISGYSRRATENVRGVRRQPCARSTKPRHGSTARSGARPSSEMSEDCERWSRSSMSAVKRTST